MIREMCVGTVLILIAGAFAGAPAAGQCAGDCNGDGRVVINELIVGVNVALGRAAVASCPAADANRDGAVRINDLVAAVGSGLDGCTEEPLLVGPADMLVRDAARDVDVARPHPLEHIEMDEEGVEVVRTAIEIGWTATATVAQANVLLIEIGGRITSMLAGVPIMVVAIPDPGGLPELDALIARVGNSPGVLFAQRATLPVPDVLPPNYSIEPGEFELGFISHLLAIRAPAAWNVEAALRADAAPLLLVGDYFGLGAPGADFAATIDAADFETVDPASLKYPSDLEHGYHVLGIVTATFGGADDTGEGLATGVVPIRSRVRVVDLAPPIDSATFDDRLLRIARQFGGNVVLNTSLGGCPRDNPSGGTCAGAAASAQAAIPWVLKVQALGLEPRLIHLTAGGNHSEESPPRAEFSSKYAAAALVDLSDFEVDGMRVSNLHNILVVENVIDNGFPSYTPGCRNRTSKAFGTISAVGTAVHSLVGPMAASGRKTGTSMATPGVAGVAALVWSVAPQLTAVELKRLLRDTARVADLQPNANCSPLSFPAGVVDAFAALLATDAAAAATADNSPVRHALLDQDQDGDFDGDDIFAHRAVIENRPPGPLSRDYGIHDLNGDGSTGSPISTAAFDLDRTGSVPFGAPVHGEVVQLIEGVPVPFNERAVRDLDVLCYYAYSALYTGTDDERFRELDPIRTCLGFELGVVLPSRIELGAPVTLTVLPTITTPAGNVIGVPDLVVELTVAGGTVATFAGSTDARGVFTTSAEIFSGNSVLAIDVAVRGGPGGRLLASQRVEATLAAEPTPTRWLGTVTLTTVLTISSQQSQVVDGNLSESQMSGEISTFVERTVEFDLVSGVVTQLGVTGSASEQTFSQVINHFVRTREGCTEVNKKQTTRSASLEHDSTFDRQNIFISVGQDPAVPGGLLYSLGVERSRFRGQLTETTISESSGCSSSMSTFTQMMVHVISDEQVFTVTGTATGRTIAGVSTREEEDFFGTSVRVVTLTWNLTGID
jgi:hypothetical protein